MPGSNELYPPINFNTAVIMCAGKATRDLRHSLIRPNTLGEVGETTAFDMLTAELGKLGIKNLIVTVPEDAFVAPGFNISEYQINTWFNGNPNLQESLKKQGKEAAVIERAGPRRHGINEIRFAYQSPDVYGTSWGVGTALPYLPRPEDYEDPDYEYVSFEEEVDGVCILNGDGFNWRSDGGSDVGDLFIEVNNRKASGGFVTMKKPNKKSGTYDYGVVGYDENGKFLQFHEKAKAEELRIPGDVLDANAGIYAFRAEDLVNPLWKHMNTPLEQLRTPPPPEHWFTDVPGWMVREGKEIIALEGKGVFVDCASEPLRQAARKLIVV